MPLQSKRISLTALGIDNVSGLIPGHHLRIGFDPRMGFPPCGFVIHVRGHATGPTRKIEVPRLFAENIPAPFRHGLLQTIFGETFAVFHPAAPAPTQGPAGSIVLTKQTLGVSFRRTPFMPDSTAAVCEIRVRVQAQNSVVTVEAFDDRYDNSNGFQKILVAREQRTFGPTFVEQVFHLRADMISLVEIKAPAGGRLVSFEYILIIDRLWNTQLVVPADQAWGATKPVPFLLPTPKFVNATSSTYPTCSALTFARSVDQIEKELPLTRLKSGFVPRASSDDVHAEYDDVEKFFDVYLGPQPARERFIELNKILHELLLVAPAQQLDLMLTNPGDVDESSTFAPLPMLLTGSVDYAFARLLGLAGIDEQPLPQGFMSVDYRVEARWSPEVPHVWIHHGVFRGRDKELGQPEPPIATPVLDVTRPGDVKTNVQLDWITPNGAVLVNREHQFAGYHVFRRSADPLGDPVRLTESKDELTGITTPDLLLIGEVQGDEPAPPPPAHAAHYLDRPPAYSTFQYGLQAQDLFGRRSKIAWGPDVKVPVLVDPPPVSDLFAFYLDTNDPGQDELDARAADILSVTGQSSFTGTALLISFRYPQASIDAIAGDVASFNVSYRHGRPNELLGTLGTASIIGPPPSQATAPVLADVELATVTPVPLGINGYGGERSRGALESHTEFFAIESATRLGSNLVRLRVRARRDYLPQTGEASLSIGAGGPGVTAHPLFVSPRDPASWTGFDIRHPQGSGGQGPLKLSAASNTVQSPLPVGVPLSQVVVSRRVEPPSNLEEGEAEIPTDWVYRIVVKNIELPLPEGLSKYPGAVTVHVMSGANRRSELTAPANVRRSAYGAPPPLTELATSEFSTATRPDFEGRIAVPLTWPKIAGVQQYNVYRVEVPTLLDARDADLQLAQDLFENESNRAQVKLLGGQLASTSAFTLITPVPITPETDPESPARHRWIDRISAPRDQSYLYRVQSISVVGNEAPWPADSAVNNENRNRCILVLQKNRDLLLPPAIYELEPLDRSIGVVIRHPLSPTVNGLRIYKTDQAAKVSDVRTMTLIHGTIPFTHERIELLPAENGTPARLRFVDGKVQVGTQYFYCIAFVDEFGNLSQASEPRAATPRAFAPPQPPTLTAERTGPDSVTLTWQADHNEGDVKPQRKHSGAGQWLDVAPDFMSPTGSVVDNAATGIVAHRLLLRDAKGRVVFSETVITEA
jgi:hypothetical protein